MSAFSERIAKAEVLVEALPYMQGFRGMNVVIKYGGSAMEDPALVETVLRDIVFLEAVGINPVIVHGGGKAISQRMKEAGLKPVFAGGLRVTDAASIDIVADVLNHVISPGIVKKIGELGGSAVACPGPGVFRAKKSPPIQVDGQAVDLGFVGELTGCETGTVQAAVRKEQVPVISPLGRDASGQLYNINADTAAAEMAVALGAAKMIYLSDVNGLLRDPADPSTRIPTVTLGEIESLKKEGVISGGMLPKVESFAKVIRSGVKKVHLIDGRIPHALLLELFTDCGIGTEILA
jgi:acetylglutamate kinase